MKTIHKATESVAILENTTFPTSGLQVLCVVLPTITTRKDVTKRFNIIRVIILLLLCGFERVIKRDRVEEVPLGGTPNGGNHTRVALIVGGGELHYPYCN